MKSLSLAALIFCAAPLNASLSQESSRIGNWVLTQKVDVMTDKLELTASNNNKAAGTDQGIGFILIGCFNGSLGVLFSSGEVLDKYNLYMFYRVDKSPAKRLQPQYGSFDYFPVAPQDIPDLLSEMQRGKQIAVRVSAHEGYAEGVFDLAGTVEVVTRIKKTCR